MTDPPDELDDLLAPRPGGPSPDLRSALLRRTERHLARARLVRRLAKAAAVAAVFAIGGAAGWLAKPDPAPVPPGDPATVFVFVPVPVPAPVADAPGSPNPAPDSPSVVPAGPLATATQLELRAEQSDDLNETARLYRLAGDGYLKDQDYRNATRCYRLFLARAGDAALAPDSADTWLLTALKNDAFKEKTDATNAGG